MNKSFSAILFLCLIFSFYEISDASYTYKGLKTFFMNETKSLVTINDKKYGDINTTQIQGMNVGQSYIYIAKINSNGQKAVAFWRKTIDSNNLVEMTCYTGGKKTNCPEAGHANDLQVLYSNYYKKNYLFVARSDDKLGVASFEIDGQKLNFKGYFKILDTETKKGRHCNSVRQYSHSNNEFVLMFKYGETFHYGKIKDSAEINGGSADKPKEISAYRLGIFDKKNMVYAKSNSSYEFIPNLETWTGQGFCYNADEKVIYTPYFDPSGSEITKNVILTYYVGDLLKNLDFKTNKNTIVFPTLTSFLLEAKDIKLKDMEIESCGFRTPQPTNVVDKKFYISANAKSQKYDIIYYFPNFKSGETGTYNQNKKTVLDFSVDAGLSKYGKVVYTVKYTRGEGEGSMSNTTHIYGIKNNLRPNSFTRNGYIFNGWKLHRQMKNETIFNNNGEKLWLNEDEGIKRGLKFWIYDDKKQVSALTTLNGDTIIATAQWKK